jgi:hypothetical protein
MTVYTHAVPMALREANSKVVRLVIPAQLTAITHDPMAAKGLLRHSSVKTTLAHYIKDVPEVTANGMAQVEQLFSGLNAAEQAVQ